MNGRVRFGRSTMNVHVTTLANTQLVDQKDTAFAQDVIAGLTQQPKQLSPKYFYDEVGSRLFDWVMPLVDCDRPMRSRGGVPSTTAS